MSSRGKFAGATSLAVAIALSVGAACSDTRDGDRAAADESKPQSREDSTGSDYIIRAGDYLSGIADAADVSLDGLVAANGWPEGADHAIYPGDVIRLPPGADVPQADDGGETGAAANDPDDAAASPGAAASVASACQNGRFFDSNTPVEGDTIETFAAKVGVTVEDIRANNGYGVTMPDGRPMFGTFEEDVAVRFPCRRNWPEGVEFSVVPEGEVCGDTSGAGNYTVRAGDTPATLAARWGISEHTLFDANSRIDYPSYPDMSATSVAVDDAYRSFQPADLIDVCTSFWGQ